MLLCDDAAGVDAAGDERSVGAGAAAGVRVGEERGDRADGGR